jgi:hypothetical protein
MLFTQAWRTLLMPYMAIHEGPAKCIVHAWLQLWAEEADARNVERGGGGGVEGDVF